MEDKRLRELVSLIFEDKFMQCPRCHYFGEFPIGTNYDKNNKYHDNPELTICPVCREIF